MLNSKIYKIETVKSRFVSGKTKLFIQRSFSEVRLFAFLFSFIQRSILVLRRFSVVVCIVGLCILPPAISSAQIIAAGNEHSLSVCSDSTARSWGANYYGQLGVGTIIQHNTPGQVHSVTDIIAVAAEGDNCLFLKNDSTVWGCGYNGWGDIGDGTTTDRHSPVHVPSLSGITKVDCGLFLSLFLKNDSTVWACGKNAYGTLGKGTYDSSPHPIPSQVLITGVTAIAGGGEHSLFVKNDSTVWACGDNVFGELGIGTSDNNPHYIPVQVNSLTGIIAVESGWSHNLYLKNDGTVWACGANGAGELGDGTTTGRTSPVQVNSLTGIIAMACGDSHSLFLKNDSTVWVCGLNNWGQLGDGTTTNKHTPVQLTSLTGIIGIAAGSTHSLFLKNDGTLWACGRNAEGQLGNGTSDTYPHPTPGLVTGLCPVITAITEQKQDPDFSSVQIYPNPTTGQFTINLGSNNKNVEVTITDITGKIFYNTIATDAQKIEVYTNDFAEGIYVVQIQSADFIATKKLVVEK